MSNGTEYIISPYEVLSRPTHFSFLMYKCKEHKNTLNKDYRNSLVIALNEIVDEEIDKVYEELSESSKLEIDKLEFRCDHYNYEKCFIPIDMQALLDSDFKKATKLLSEFIDFLDIDELEKYSLITDCFTSWKLIILIFERKLRNLATYPINSINLSNIFQDFSVVEINRIFLPRNY